MQGGPDPKEGGEIDVHVNQRALSQQSGMRLDSASGPRELFEALLHSMLGHWDLFKNGCLHRDVSTGNICVLKQRVQRPAVTDFEATMSITECIGVITDGDQAINWKLDQRELATHRSGTLPFTSLRLLNAWQNSRVAVHTAIDDIESFLWVLIWALLASIRRRGVLLPAEQIWFHSMNADSNLGRCGILRRITLSAASKQASRLICHFSSIIQTWGEFSLQAAVAIASLVAENPGEPVSLEKYTALCRGFYGKYIDAGVAELSKLPETWAEVGL
ncbi:hypothetical protein BJ138DRAFT_1016872 [Hygrophoropsis aurantiaca]|uniref:Uncharacterized protein n=1 Tax=Hygrophoropsis aurantiaca TaxID=72124 RepID=A0ACB7ZZ17_9AGAM|nr:hypothetical protein BJ138DRAFT_1016872 [Hygrophoropsis aurantiaca]